MCLWASEGLEFGSPGGSFWASRRLLGALGRALGAEIDFGAILGAIWGTFWGPKSALERPKSDAKTNFTLLAGPGEGPGGALGGHFGDFFAVGLAGTEKRHQKYP